MKLLLDHNLSPRLVALLQPAYEECEHVHSVALDRASDTEVWAYAAAHGYTIVSKDADFYQRSTVLGSPPKVVWLRIGNCTVAQSAAILRERYLEVRRFVEQSRADCLILA